MPYFYFFKQDMPCNWMEKEIKENFPRYLTGPLDFEGKKIKFYAVLNWVRRSNKGANLNWLNRLGINYVETIRDLPAGAGIYITGYDSAVDELFEAKRQGIPVIEHPCPWIRQLRNQLLNADFQTHQAVIMIDKDHMVYDCYKTIMPKDAIIINEKNYQEQIKLASGHKPIIFFVYSVYRRKDIQRVLDFINLNYSNPANSLDNYLKTQCCWMKQGLFEELEQMIPAHKLNQIWIICSSEEDRSSKSIINEVIENNAVPVIIKQQQDIPDKIAAGARIGVLLAPIPLGKEIINLKRLISTGYPQEKNI